MPDINLGALTIPIFATIFGAGWLSCYSILVKPLTARIEKMETKQEAIENERDDELRSLRQLLMDKKAHA